MTHPTFWRRIHALGFATYADYLASEHWQTTRRRFISSGIWKGKCHGCRRLLENPEIHHRTYARIGHERLDDLNGLCRDCHIAAHDFEKRGLNLKSATHRVKRRRKMVTVR
jgi:5-methylcytosine-specific restriction endonuclease McrA